MVEINFVLSMLFEVQLLCVCVCGAIRDVCIFGNDDDQCESFKMGSNPDCGKVPLVNVAALCVWRTWPYNNRAVLYSWSISIVSMKKGIRHSTRQLQYRVIPPS